MVDPGVGRGVSGTRCSSVEHEGIFWAVVYLGSRLCVDQGFFDFLFEGVSEFSKKGLLILLVFVSFPVLFF